MSCALCDKPISNDDSFFELNCGVHLGHAHHKSLKCGCTNQNVGSSLVAPSSPSVVSSKHARMLNRDATEPLVPRQHGPVSSFIGTILSSVSQLVAASAPVEESNDPFVLLRARVPLTRVMVEKHAIGIAELINDHGVTINDFFGNGYTIGDMCDAFPTRMNTETGLDVLGSLGMHEEHFRRLPQLSQIGLVRDRLGYVPADMVRRFGYQYANPSSGGWTLSELVSVGLDMPLVMEAGLVRRNQWEELKQTGTPAELALFGATPALVSSLAAPVVDPPPAAAASMQAPVQQQPVWSPVMAPQKVAHVIVGLPMQQQDRKSVV